MTRDDIIRMAEHAGFGMPVQVFQFRAEELERFARLVAAAEREACAKICDETRFLGYCPPEDGAAPEYYDAAAQSCAKEIRARGEV
ncbi:MAG: hypothetical protein EBW12_07640 [Actinobacteria bacterium]|nr:hypothetical protein [Actinomycetota bacterium]